jgi:AcrR family transcriptional regulator
VGIAQGSFYAFDPSKEELYFEILAGEERKIGEQIRKDLASVTPARREFKAFLLRTVRRITGHPLLMQLLRGGEYEALTAKVPEAAFRAHVREEQRFTGELLSRLRETGRVKPVRPRVMSGLLHALFLLHLHRDEIGKDVFPVVLELLIDLVADAVIEDGGRNLDRTTGRYWR